MKYFYLNEDLYLHRSNMEESISERPGYYILDEEKHYRPGDNIVSNPIDFVYWGLDNHKKTL